MLQIFFEREDIKILHRNPIKSTMENKMRILSKILAHFDELVSPEFCNHLAKKCLFVQRSTSQLQGYEFARVMLIPHGSLEAETLHSLAVRMRSINKMCDMSASALAQRINTQGAESFMKACFGTVLKGLVKNDFDSLKDLPILSIFRRILIQDSTKIELHEKLSSDFKGSGGVASTASVKIDFIFDYLSGQPVDVHFCSGNMPDQKLADRLMPMLKKYDLVIRDLGYFIINSLHQIEEKGAFFISRWKVNECVYETKEAREPLDLANFLDKHVVNGFLDTHVFIGKGRHAVRLVACHMSQEGFNKRSRDANSAAKRRGTQVSKKKRALLRYNIFITNVNSNVLSKESIIATYSARWRIELSFKEWKSCLKMHMFKGYNKNRIHCFLYGRLVMVLLLGALYPALQRYALEFDGELSTYKVIKYLIFDNALFRMLQEGKQEVFIRTLLDDIPRRLCMDKRNRPSLRENVRIGRTKYHSINDLGENVA